MVRLCLSLAILAVGCNAAAAPGPVVDAEEVTGLTNLLVRVAEWTVVEQKNSTIPHADRPIFIFGNLARVLLAAHKITGNPDYLVAGLGWCDRFLDQQLSLTTSTGDDGGYWDTGYREIFIADTGTAVTALTVCVDLQPDIVQRERYLSAMSRYARFVTGGCKTPPTNPNVTSVTGPAGCPPKGDGWVIGVGSVDAGGLGDGWYRRELNAGAYTIATATTGSCALVEMSNLGVDVQGADLDNVAANAIGWLLKSRTADGAIPYIIHPHDNSSVVFQPITYSTESMIIADLRYPHLHAELATLKSTVHFLVDHQNADGSWGVWTRDARDLAGRNPLGFSPDADAIRSPRAVSLLQWYVMHVEADPAVSAAIAKFVKFLLDPAKMKAFGVCGPDTDSKTANEASALVTGFVGLAAADLIKPWSTFNPTK
jgi:hypothetical protein